MRKLNSMLFAVACLFAIFQMYMTDESKREVHYSVVKSPGWEDVRAELKEVLNSSYELEFDEKLNAFSRKHFHTMYKPFSKGKFSYNIGDQIGYTITKNSKLLIYKDGSEFFTGEKLNKLFKAKVPAVAMISTDGNVTGSSCPNVSNALIVLDDSFVVIDVKDKIAYWSDESLLEE